MKKQIINKSIFLMEIILILISIYIIINFNSEKIPILMYHSITDEKEESKIIISKKRFESDLQYILDKGYNPITFYDLIDYKEKDVELPERPVIITFDDGLLSNYDNAFPLLKKYNTKATIFLIASRAGVKNYNGVKYWTYFNWEQARDMEESGLIDINPHSYALHNYEKNEEHGQGLNRAKRESKEDYYNRIVEDTKMADKIFKKELNKKPIIFAYPFGNFNKTTEEILKKLGYKVTLTTKSKMANIEDDLFALKRYNRGKDFKIERVLK